MRGRLFFFFRPATARAKKNIFILTHDNKTYIQFLSRADRETRAANVGSPLCFLCSGDTVNQSHFISCTMPPTFWLTLSFAQLVDSTVVVWTTCPFMVVTQLHFFLQPPRQASTATMATTVNTFFIVVCLWWVLFIHFLAIQTDRTHYSVGQPLFDNRFTGAKIRLFFHLTISNLSHFCGGG